MTARVPRIVLTFSITVALILAAAPALGHQVERTDPNDVPGLDTRTVGYRHADGQTYLKIEFYDAPQTTQFGTSDVIYRLYTRGDSNSDADVEFRYGSDPEGYFCYIFDNESNYKRAVPITRQAKTMRCNFKSKLVGGVAEGFHVDVYAGSKDFSPDTGKYRHN